MSSEGTRGVVDSPATPAWLVRATSVGVRLGLLGAVLWLGAVLASRLTLLLVAMAVAALVAGAAAPLVHAADRRRVPRWLSSLTVVLSLLGVLGGVVWVIGASVAEEVPQLRDQLTQLGEQAQELTDGYLGGIPGVDGGSSGAAGAGADGTASDVVGVATTGFEVLVAGFVALALAFLVLKDGHAMWDWVLSKVPGHRRHQLQAAGVGAWSTLGTYVRGLTIVALFDAVGIGIGLLLLGVPLVLTLAVLQFLLSYIPTIGALVAGAVAAAVALASGGPTTAALTVLLVVVVQQLGNSVVEPWVMGRGLGLHPAVVLVAVTAGGLLWGIAGALLFVPLTGAAVAAARALSRHRRDAVEPERVEPQQTPLAPPTPPTAQQPDGR